MVDEPDRIDEALTGALRVGLTVAGHVAERALRAREQAMRDAQARSEQEARVLQARLDSERAAARAALAPVDRDEWWQHASVDDISRAWETAQTWRELDADARRAGERMHDELQRRYGIDTSDLQADPAAVRAALERAERSRGQSDQERDAATAESAEAAALVAGADQLDDRVDSAQRDVELDDADRHLGDAVSREALADSLAGVAEEETVQARVVAATNQARPAREAVAAAPRRAPRARRARTPAGRERDRSQSR